MTGSSSAHISFRNAGRNQAVRFVGFADTRDSRDPAHRHVSDRAQEFFGSIVGVDGWTVGRAGPAQLSALRSSTVVVSPVQPLRRGGIESAAESAGPAGVINDLAQYAGLKVLWGELPIREEIARLQENGFAADTALFNVHAREAAKWLRQPANARPSLHEHFADLDHELRPVLGPWRLSAGQFEALFCQHLGSEFNSADPALAGQLESFAETVQACPGGESAAGVIRRSRDHEVARHVLALAGRGLNVFVVGTHEAVASQADLVGTELSKQASWTSEGAGHVSRAASPETVGGRLATMSAHV